MTTTKMTMMTTTMMTNDNQDKDEDNGRPGYNGCRRGEEDMATMASPQAGKTSANNNCWVRLPIDAQCRKVERGMMAVQHAGRSIEITHKNGLPISVTFHPLQFDVVQTKHERRHYQRPID